MHNLGYRTDCIFHRHDGVVEERDDYWVIRTPSNPTYWFGNLLLFRNAPRSGDEARWLERHAAEFGDSLNHITIAWDEEIPGESDGFIAQGFRLESSAALSLAHTDYADSSPPPVNPALTVRPVTDDHGWREVVRVQTLCDDEDPHFDADGGAFRTRQALAAHRMIENGRGTWWGAYDRDTLLGSLGLFFDETGELGRFQYVTTDPAHRRRKACSTLLDHAIRHAFTTVGAKTLVICTEGVASNPAMALYQRFGFRPAGQSYAVTRLIG
ncbi:GNAT family N-acetyltransferase [Actomonas aquatica]|uniref:GNAT family N-acetyltransferase n=1 Tax=Actomonas aquatica TaxID=2866162 RepID=A0ABZ1C2W9_9BACT|nr:GNAT family N-acetyltransferase [Opitutus sp. WL0086]WRQ86051.1 GNAT family N-acetyltransferase [Opitutus sp. WL0086]